MSSLDRFLIHLSNSNNNSFSSFSPYEASQTILQWWRKIQGILHVRKDLQDIENDLIFLLNFLLQIEQEEMTFQFIQDLMKQIEFQNSLQNFLIKLPRDPSLKNKNKFAKNIRLLSSAFVIKRFPNEVLQNDDQPDTSPEANSCIKSANILIFALKRLCNSLKRNFKAFRYALIGYRFCVRDYLESLDKWKAIDQDRSQSSYELSYMEAFAILVTTQQRMERLNRLRSSHGKWSYFCVVLFYYIRQFK